MTEFEYISKSILYTTNYEFIQKLNEFGKEGWEFCTFDEYATTKTITGIHRSIILKRVKTTVSV